MRHITSLYFSSCFWFQSTHPLRDATLMIRYSFKRLINFNPRTPYGMRLPSTHEEWLADNFNPRTPYGMRLLDKFLKFNVRGISIHAPLTGCDSRNCLSICHWRLFQSTHPLRDATRTRWTILKQLQFQSTHPLRDATAKKAKSLLEFHSFWQIHIIIFTELW